MNSLLVILINLISSLIRWSSTPKPILGLDCTYNLPFLVIDDNPITAYKRYEMNNWDFFSSHGRRASPKYVNRELNSQLGIRGQDSHFSEVKIGAPPTSMPLWGASCNVKKIYTWCIWQIMHTCACCCSWVLHYRTWLYEQYRVKHHAASSDKKDMQPSTIRWHLIHTNDTCPYLIHKESNSSIIS